MRRFGFLSSTTAIITTALTLVGISGVAVASGNAMFAPGSLSAKSGPALGGVTSHSAIPECGDCHASPWSGERMADRCLACHTDVSAELQDPQSLHSLVKFSEPDLDCRACHTDHHGPAASLTQMRPGWNPHAQLGYALDTHRLRMDGTPFECRDCHVNGYSAPFDQNVCADCHLQVDAVFTQEHVLTFWTDCLACHDGLDSHGHKFDHTKTPFALIGLHTQTACSGCHVSARNLNDLMAAPQDCYSCHQKDDLHETRFGTECGACHTPEGWAKSAQFDHNISTFKLTGRHVPVTCGGCHKNRIYQGTPADCYSCHAAHDKHNGGFGTDCVACHTPDGWERNVDHSQFAFKLDGKHVTAECAACHIGGVFKGTPTDCASCHAADDAHAGTLGLQCANCHTTTAWSPASFDHNSVRFVLTAHKTRVDGLPFVCRDCHVAGYTPPFNQNTCADCHFKVDLAFTQDHILTFWTDCNACHDGVDSHGSSFDHNRVPFSLAGRHADAACSGCHVNARNLTDLKTAPQDCYVCHQKDDFHAGRFGTNCSTCHSPNGWKPATFDHNLAAFQLVGKHVPVACENCHKNGVFKGTPMDCVACHADDDRHAGQFGTNCASCHTSEGWELARVDHSKFLFPLTGKHTAVACENCHAGGVFKGTPQDCVSCHLKNDAHAGRLGTQCASCHTTNGWKPASFDHNSVRFTLTAHKTKTDGSPFACQDCHTAGYSQPFDQNVCANCHLQVDLAFAQEHILTFWTDCVACHDGVDSHGSAFDHNLVPFQLSGQHAQAKCAQCHISARTLADLKAAPQNCYACHQSDDTHQGALGTDCAACHSSSGWKPSSFDHNRSAFKLAGKHGVVACSACHQNGVFKGTPQDCASCHLKDDRHNGQFGTNCATCHTPEGWELARVDHSKFAFPLIGKHTAVACEACHAGGVFKGTPTNCAACHLRNDPHSGKLGTDCASCHTSNGWSPSTYDHNRSIFPLSGRHITVTCSQCHKDKLFKGAPTNCAACHSAQDPHGGALGSDCASCHTTSGWKPSTFNHTHSIFQLTGAHVTVSCSSCHKDKRFKGTPTNCYACHAKNDRHGGKFGTSCGSCHTTTAWKPASFDHSKSAFPLTGKHTSAACTSCHVNGVYAGTPKDCYSCHAKNDKHGGKYGTSCSSCHTTTAWKPATFDHSKSVFPLTGAHISAVCAKCHVNGVYKGTPTTCVSCHADPAYHKGAFGTNCVSCHNTSNWRATYTGSHPAISDEGGSGVNHGNTTCRTCHPTTVHTYTCLACHSDNQGGEGGEGGEDDDD